MCHSLNERQSLAFKIGSLFMSPRERYMFFLCHIILYYIIYAPHINIYIFEQNMKQISLGFNV